MQKKIGEYIIAPAYVYYTDMKTFSSLDFSYGMSTFGVIKKLLGQTIQSGVYDHIYTPYGRTVIRFWTYGFREDFGFLGLLFFFNSEKSEDTCLPCIPHFSRKYFRSSFQSENGFPRSESKSSNGFSFSLFIRDKID